MSDGPSKSRTRGIRSIRMRASEGGRSPLHRFTNITLIRACRKPIRGLANWRSRLTINPLENPRGSTDVNRNWLAVHAPSLESARSAGIHELKHSVEKHPPGGSPDQFMKWGIPEQEAYDLYNRLVGEVAARNAQKRLVWGDIIRRYRRPATTEDVPRHRQINLYDE